MRFVLSVLCLLLLSCSREEIKSVEYKGTIGRKIGVTGVLQFENSKISGTYHYDIFKRPVRIEGLKDGNHLVFSGIDSDGTLIDKFDGVILSDYSMSGNWMSADGKREMPFRYHPTNTVFQKATSSGLYIGTTFALILIAVSLLYNRKSKKSVAFGSTNGFTQASVKKYSTLNQTVHDIYRSSESAEKPLDKMSPAEKGKAFEDYVIHLLPEKFYSLDKRTGDRITSNGRYSKDVHDPDLVFSIKNGNEGKKQFAIECKWRRKTVGKFVSIDIVRKIQHYMNYSKNYNIPTFILLGSGGRPGNPARLYIIPINRIVKSPYRTSDQYGVYQEELEKFEKNNGHATLFYNKEIEVLT